MSCGESVRPIDLYIQSQKRWITRFYAKSQLRIVEEHPDWIKGKDVIDIGCGCGVLEAMFAGLAGSFISCDVKDYNLYGLKVVVCSAQELPQPDNSFDTAFMLGVIEHVENKKQAIGECYRVLRNRGKLIVSIPNGFAWQLLRCMSPFLPQHLQEHADFEQKKLLGLMSGWRLVWSRTIVSGLFWMYEFEVDKSQEKNSA